jgi:hypothetical protein
MRVAEHSTSMMRVIHLDVVKMYVDMAAVVDLVVVIEVVVQKLDINGTRRVVPW